jgi:hypothetical protein
VDEGVGIEAELEDALVEAATQQLGARTPARSGEEGLRVAQSDLKPGAIHEAEERAEFF